MDSLSQRFEQLEKRVRKLERNLRVAKLTALTAAIIAGGAFYGASIEAQPPGAQGSTLRAPVTITGTNGATLLRIDDFNDTDRKSHDTMLTFYRNDQPAAIFRTTGAFYKDAADPQMNFLNVFETWLYKYEQSKPTPYLASSVALTRSGGSIVVYNDQGPSSTTPPMAARLTAKGGIGGRLILFNPKGLEGKVIDP